MEVYVVPIGRDRYELYCEVAREPDLDVDESPPEGFFGRLRHRFSVARLRRRFGAILHDAEEREHRTDADGDAERKGWWARAQDRFTAWVAERIAEQRLLWNLRGRTGVIAMHPDDMPFEQVHTLIRRVLQRDYDRHKVWLVVDTLGLLASAPLIFAPGPNAFGYYFLFRVVGHWLSMRGASQGLHRILWSGRECPPLTELRRVVAMAPGDRGEDVRDIAARLHLPRLPRFFDRVARGPA